MMNRSKVNIIAKISARIIINFNFIIFFLHLLKYFGYWHLSCAALIKCVITENLLIFTYFISHIWNKKIGTIITFFFNIKTTTALPNSEM